MARLAFQAALTMCQPLHPQHHEEVMTELFVSYDGFQWVLMELWGITRAFLLEYWIVSWQQKRIEIYRRIETVLTLVSSLYETDTLQSPLLPGFACPVNKLFMGIR
jgi:hypothetical protein